MPLHLIIANKAYSSWSLRPWLALHLAELPFTEEVIPLGTPAFAAAVAAGRLPAAKVPTLWDGDVCVWDSLAIIEYVAERAPQLWPADPAARAVARAVSAEMHSGFQALRADLQFNIRKRYPGYAPTQAALDDVARIEALWDQCRSRYGAGGAFLFGAPSAADAMYAPVVTRLLTYDVAVSPITRAYMDAVLALPAMQAWIRDGQAEPWVMDKYEKPGGVAVFADA
jgi:glutathione S-transferase